MTSDTVLHKDGSAFFYDAENKSIGQERLPFSSSLEWKEAKKKITPCDGAVSMSIGLRLLNVSPEEIVYADNLRFFELPAAALLAVSSDPQNAQIQLRLNTTTDIKPQNVMVGENGEVKLKRGDELVVGDIPADMLEKAKNARSLLVENAVEADDELMMRFLEEGEDSITVDELKAALRKRVLAGDFYLVTGGDGRGVIVEKVLDLMVDYLPSPVDVAEIWGKNPKTGEEIARHPNEKEPLSALAFKIATDPFVGKLIFVRVYSGVLNAGSYVLNTTTGEKERVGRIVRMHADKREDINEIGAGDIAAVVGLKIHHRQATLLV